jgi:hypothetical protein
MPVNARYSTSARAVCGRNGRTTTLDRSLDVKPSMPRVSPESPSLRLVGWTSCTYGI